MSDDTNLPTIPRLDGRGQGASPAPAAEKPFQFSLRHLFVATLVVAVVVALPYQFGPTPLVVALLVLGIVAMCYGAYWGNGWFLGGLVLTGLMLGMSVWPSVFYESNRYQRRIECRNQLQVIGIALHNYHDTYKTFPPAYIADTSGKPMHSWRVLLLPFMEEQTLYDQYRFDEPWDGPNNRLLANSMPRLFRCPSEPNTDPPSGMTSYLAVVGPETAWPGAKAIALNKIKDGSDYTLLVVESHNSGIHWMEPRDLHTTQMPLAVNPTHGQGICSCHNQVNGRPTLAQYVRCDGSVGVLKNDTPPATIRALLTIAGGEEVDPP
jgi:hypothetical protein